MSAVWHTEWLSMSLWVAVKSIHSKGWRTASRGLSAIHQVMWVEIAIHVCVYVWDYSSIYSISQDGVYSLHYTIIIIIITIIITITIFPSIEPTAAGLPIRYWDKVENKLSRNNFSVVYSCVHQNKFPRIYWHIDLALFLYADDLLLVSR